MSVHRSKRRISRFELEHSFSILYTHTIEQLSHVSKRRRKWLCPAIAELMNHMYNLLMRASIRISRKGVVDETRSELIVSTLKDLSALQKPLWVLWNVCEYPTKKMIRWITLINEAKKIMLYELAKDTTDVKDFTIYTLDWDKVKRAKFLHMMSKLHRYTHGKVVHAQSKYDSTSGSMLINLVDEAFYQLIRANARIPTTRVEYIERRDCINQAIVCLREMNRPLLMYFNTQHYSESTMCEWSEMLRQEINMLIALSKSDQKRFDSLK